jgi:signal transduction histidine kinase
MLAKICREFRPRAEEAGLSLECELDSAIFLQSHPDQIYHGIVNLLKNALESCASGDRIEVSLRRKAPSRIEVVVRDTGRGMDAAELAKALSIGFTTKADGHGLGLHSFAVFLSANRGRLRLESPGIGQGCSAIMEIEDA